MSFLRKKIEIDRLNYAFIVLIHKKTDASEAGDFRSISLLNVVYKIITKVLTKRLDKKKT